MGLPIVTLSRLLDRKHFRAASAGTVCRVAATCVLLALVLPVLLTAALATLPVLLTAGLAVGVRRVWQWQSHRRDRREADER